VEGETVMVAGKVVELGVKRFRGGSRSVFELVINDGSARLRCRWWNMPYMKDQFKRDQELIIIGKVRSLKPAAMDHPETEAAERDDEPSVHIGRIVPIYPLTEGVGQRGLRAHVWRALQKVSLSDLWNEALGSPTRHEAVARLHFPETLEQAAQARRRLALDEFLELQIAIRARRRKMLERARPIPAAGDNRWMRPFLGALSYTLTNAQTTVLREIRADMNGGQPMRRLLQGDVGSGKTVVAACAALMALESGYNVALMAPTEILAEQHHRTFTKWLAPFGIEVLLRTGERKDVRYSESKPTLVIGTHALLSENFALERLGLVIIDEQHKFGVTQRAALLRKGDYPHLLVMTATPIPRTLGLTVYGDLDMSVIDELPAGRQPIRTFIRTTQQLPKVLDFIREKLAAGRQAYIVYPRVETADAEIKAATRELERLRSALKPHSVGLIHGAMHGSEADAAMQAFRAGKLAVLVATSVIEVGVDVPNATIMLIENAERFGLAQLHQLRGRIGRGAEQSYCILLSDAKNEVAVERLGILERTTSGFQIAEADLNLRGPGDFLGEEQSGVPKLRFGDLTRDLDLIEQARFLAVSMGGGDPSKR
jgi:ATP-dependent DNA helicase RecG